MIDLEERISSVLGAAADTIPAVPLSPGRPQLLARRRRRNRNAGVVAALLVAVLGLGAALRYAPGADSSLDTADEHGLDADGLPVGTGPQLEWERVDGAEDLRLAHVVWSGERFVATGGAEGERLFVSVDGRTWDPVDRQWAEGSVLVGLASGDGRLVAWHRAPADDGTEAGWPLTGETLVMVSDDHGATWRDLGPLGEAHLDEDPTDYITNGEFVNTMAIDGDTVVALTARHPWPNVNEFLVDRGLIESDDVVLVESVVVQADTAEVSATYCVADGGNSCDDLETVEFLAPGMEGYRFGAQPSTVWTSVAGGAFEPVAEVEGEAFRVVPAGDGFLALSWSGQHLLQRSTDGRTWTAVELDAPVHTLSGSDAEVVATGGTGEGTDYYRSGDGGVTWSRQGVPIHLEAIAVGPGGHVVTGAAYEPARGPVGAFVDWVFGRGSGDGPRLIGWSANGVDWGWQSWDEAFGPSAWATVAVGTDSTVAVVYGSGDGRLSSTPAQLFVAEVGP